MGEYSRHLIGRLARVREEKNCKHLFFKLSPLLPREYESELKTAQHNCLLHTEVSFHTVLGAKGPDSATLHNYVF